jgi:hypothetical protein
MAGLRQIFVGNNQNHSEKQSEWCTPIERPVVLQHGYQIRARFGDLIIDTTAAAEA